MHKKNIRAAQFPAGSAATPVSPADMVARHLDDLKRMAAGLVPPAHVIRDQCPPSFNVDDLVQDTVETLLREKTLYQETSFLVDAFIVMRSLRSAMWRKHCRRQCLIEINRAAWEARYAYA